jgi:cytochrome c oxidase accessory protein FixG
MVSASPAENWKSFGVVTFLTGALYFCFAWFREQFCIIMCPYGRIQSALTDDNTLVIGYDARRGEPRGKVGEAGAGDCIDCFRCVNVCPTGIDIREGLQIECIGCANCIDACDEIMEKVNRPSGLIRYDSMRGLNGAKTCWVRPRIVVYSVLLAIGVTVLGVSLAKVKPVQVGVVRMIGAPYYVGESNVRNQFQVRLLNKRTEASQFRVALEDAAGAILTGFESAVVVGPMEEGLHTMIVEMPLDKYAGTFDFKLVVVSDPGGVEIVRAVKFLGPDPRLLKESDPEVDEKPDRP